MPLDASRRINPHRRLRCENVDLDLEIGNGLHHLTVALAYDRLGILREVNFVGRGKIGHGVDAMLHELGIKLSRAIQGRDP
jgi:hypothetical protein